MRVCVCGCICMHVLGGVRACESPSVSVCVCVCLLGRVCSCVSVRVGVYVYVCAYMCTFVQVCVPACVCECVCVHTQTRTLSHTHAQTHIHIPTHSLKLFSRASRNFQRMGMRVRMWDGGGNVYVDLLGFCGSSSRFCFNQSDCSNA